MTPEYAAERLLELGPLTPEAFRQITGWTRERCDSTVAALVAAGVVVVNVHGLGAPTGGGRVIWLARQLPATQQIRPAAHAPARLRLVA